MSYPLVLSKEELAILRVMLKTTITNRISEVAAEHRKIVLATSNSPPDAEREDEIFVGRINTWMTHRINLDLPLINASILIREGTAVIVNLSKESFEALDKISKLNFTTTDTDEASKDLIARIQTVQPALKAAFEVAEANERAVVVPTLPMAGGRN